ARALLVREILGSSPWAYRTRMFAKVLRTKTRHPGGLLLVGTPAEEPWHLAAHLSEEAKIVGAPELSPVLVRYAPPRGAPDHLRVGMARLAYACKGETVFVVAPDKIPESLLDRLADARKKGATLLSVDEGDKDLQSLTHESLTVPPLDLLIPGEPDRRTVAPMSDLSAALTRAGAPPLSIDAVTHLIALATGEKVPTIGSGNGSRDKLRRALDKLSGPPARQRRW
ncbi:MAG: hypothetical protein ACYCU5_08740, partial [Actinomycetes bacterium]